MFAPGGVARHAILKIGNAFFAVFACNLRLVMFMASITSVKDETVWVAGLTFASRPFVIHREGMRPVVGRRFPGGCGVAGSAVRAKLAGVFLRFNVAGGAFLGRGELVVIECRIAPTGRSMTRFALRPVLPVMLVVPAVAGITVCGRAFEYIIDVAILAGGCGVFAFQLERR